jgi:hypothetical protein
LNAAPTYKAIAKQAKAIMAMEGTAEQAAAQAAQPPSDPFAPALLEERPMPLVKKRLASQPRARDFAAPAEQYSAKCSDPEGMEWPG